MKFKTGDIIQNGFYKYLILGVTTCRGKKKRYVYKVLMRRNLKPQEVTQYPTTMKMEGDWVEATDVVHQVVTCHVENIDEMFVFDSKDLSLMPCYSGEEYET